MVYSLTGIKKLITRFIGAALLVTLATGAHAQAKKVRVAFGDVLSTETVSMVIALERAKARGVDYEITFFSKEELAIQAVINGQADLGVGTPYSIIQKSKAPMRILFQGTRLVFFPLGDCADFWPFPPPPFPGAVLLNS